MYKFNEAMALQLQKGPSKEEELELKFQNLIDMGIWRDEPQIDKDSLLKDLFYNHPEILYRHVHLNKSKYSYLDEMTA